MDRSHQDSPLPWKQPSPLLQVPQDFSNPAAAYHIDIFHTFHKGLIGDLCSNSIATQLRGWLFIFYIFSFNCWYLASLKFCLDFACPHHSSIWGSVVWPQDWQPVNFLWFGCHFFQRLVILPSAILCNCIWCNWTKHIIGFEHSWSYPTGFLGQTRSYSNICLFCWPVYAQSILILIICTLSHAKGMV